MLKIANNTINGGSGTTTTLYGIFVSTATSANIDIYSNTVTIAGGATTSAIYGINNAGGSTASSNTVNIYSNTVTGCTYTTATSGIFYGIYNNGTPATLNMYGNTVSSNVLPGPGAFYGMYNAGALGTNPCNFYNNTIASNSKSGASGAMYLTYGTTATVNYYGNSIHDNSNGSGSGLIYCSYNGSSPVTESYYNNTFYNNTAGGAGTVYGIYLLTTSGTKNIYGNEIYGLSSTGGTVAGIISGYGAPLNVYKNKVYNLSSTGTGGLVYGVSVSATNSYVYNNFISDLRTPTATGTNAVIGINVTGGTTAGLFYNTVYLDATSSSATSFGTSGVSVSVTPTTEIRNNVVVNVSNPGPTSGFTVAHRRSTTTLTTYASASNGNDFYAGSGSNRFLFYDGTNSDATIAAYKSRVTPRDGASFTELPPFTNVGSTPYDLHLMNAPATQCESGGSRVTTPLAITTD
ncbi:MAG: hypothetical protein IPP94_17505 [Ignavibacteria bacterium]|nr:hypothetical protein [Ignavibacteria bacterium]